HAAHVRLSGDGEGLRMALQDLLGPLAQATGDDHPAGLLQSLADGIERLLDRGRDEAARVDDDEVRVLVRGYELVAVRSQVAQNVLAVYEGLGAPQADEPHLPARGRAGRIKG